MTDTAGWDGLLDEGETILWQGRPRPGLSLKGFHPMESAIGVFFMVFSIVWINMALNIGSNFRNEPAFVRIFPLFGLIFFFIGLWNAIGKHLWQSFLLSRTYYTLTDRRAFIAVDNPFSGRSLEDHKVGPGSPLKLYDGSPGAVQFGIRQVTRTSTTRSSFGPGRSRSITRNVPLMFERIDAPREVYAHLRAIASADPGAAPD